MFRDYLYKENAMFEKPVFEEVEEFEVSDFKVNSAELPEQTDKGYVSNLVFGVNSIEHEPSFMRINLTHPTGPMEGRMWNKGDMSSVEQELLDMRVIEISGKWNEWPKGSSKYSINIESFTKAEADPLDLIPTIKESRIDLKNELFYYINLMSEPVANLAKDILKDVWGDFAITPAAKGMHHNQLGGLLQHTVENLRIANKFLFSDYEESERALDWVERMASKIRSMKLKEHRESGGKRFFSVFYEREEVTSMLFNNFLAEVYKDGEKPNKDIVIFSTIFHDIAKIQEYTFFGEDKNKFDMLFKGLEFSDSDKSVGIDMDTKGVRLGHITMGIMFLQQEFIKRSDQFKDGDFLLDVMSCISSHHGKLEWGSITTPVTKEEYLVHICDYIGSRFASSSN